MKKSVLAFLSAVLAFVIVSTTMTVPAQAVDRDIACSEGGGTFKIVGTIVTSSTSTCRGQVVIPADVTEIGHEAFYLRGRVSSVIFEPGSQLTKLGPSAFIYSGLTSIDLPDGLQTIGGAALSGTKIKSLSIPGTVTSVGGELSFEGPLETLIFEPRVAATLTLNKAILSRSYNMINPIIFMGPGPRLTTELESFNRSGYQWGGWSTSAGGPRATFPVEMGTADSALYPIWIPDVVTTHNCGTSGTFEVRNGHAGGASSNCAGDVVIPANALTVGGFGSRNITNVTFESGSQATEIREYGFENSTLSSIDLPNGLKTIARWAFKNTKLTSLSIPGSVTSVGGEAANDNPLLETVIFESRISGAGTLSIYGDAFRNSRVLRSMTFAGATQVAGAPPIVKDVNNWLGWSATEGGSIISFPYTPSSVGADGITLYTNHSPKTFQVTFDAREGTAVAPSTIVGGEIQFPAPPTRAGYTFNGWHINANDPGSKPTTDWYVESNLALNAKWLANRYAVTFDSKGGSDQAAGYYETQDFVRLSPGEPSRLGYTFDGWSATDGGNKIQGYFYPGVIGDITLYARWLPNIWRVNIEVYGGSYVDVFYFPSDGTIQSVPTPTKEGYRFDGWADTPSGSVLSFPYTPGVYSDITLHAKWTKLLQINFDSKGGPDVQSDFFGMGESITSPPEAPTRVGYTFEGWSETDGGDTVSFPYSPDASEDITLYASWEIVVYSVTFNANGGVSVPNGSFTVERDLLLVTPIRVGYTFNGWSASEGGSFISFPYTPSVLQNITLYANWTRNPFKPELIAGDVIAGTGIQSTLLSAAGGSWLAYPEAVVTHQWYRCDKAVAAGLSALPSAAKCVKITGAALPNYKVAVPDAGKYLTALVQAKNSIGTTFLTTATFRAPPLKAPSKIQLPVGTGTAKASSYLTGTVGTWAGNPVPKTTVQWFRCENATAASAKAVPGSAQCEAIRGATKVRYKLGTADKGKYVTVQITAKNTEGEAVSTAKSQRVILDPTLVENPEISGAAGLNKSLRVNKGTWLAFPTATTTIQWYRCNRATSPGAKSFSGSSGCKAIDGATRGSYRTSAADEGKYISVLVKAVNTAGTKSVTTRSTDKVE